MDTDEGVKPLPDYYDQFSYTLDEEYRDNLTEEQRYGVFEEEIVEEPSGETEE